MNHRLMLIFYVFGENPTICVQMFAEPFVVSSKQGHCSGIQNDATGVYFRGRTLSSCLFEGIKESVAFWLDMQAKSSKLGSAENTQWLDLLKSWFSRDSRVLIPEFCLWSRITHLHVLHSHKHNAFDEIQWLQRMTHFAEAGFCFRNCGVRASMCDCVKCIFVHRNAQRGF